MDWVLLVVLAIVAAVFREITQKHALHSMPTGLMLAYRGAWIIPLNLLLIPFLSWQAPVWTYFAAILVGIVASAGFFLRNTALKHLDISYVKPLTAIRPVLIAIIAFLFLAERISTLQIIGIVLICIAIFLLEAKKGVRFSESFSQLIHNKFVLALFASAMIISITVTADRFILQTIDSLTYLFLVWNTCSIVFILSKIKELSWNARFVKLTFPPALLTIIVHVGFYGALAQIQAAIVASLFFTQVLFTTIIGGLFFKEQFLIKRTLLSALATGGGILLILL